MQDSSVDSKIEILDKLINMGEIQDAPFHGKIVSIPRINAKKPHSEFLCVEKIRQTATIPKKSRKISLSIVSAASYGTTRFAVGEFV
jgi:hypothetical protein